MLSISVFIRKVKSRLTFLVKLYYTPFMSFLPDTERLQPQPQDDCDEDAPERFDLEKAVCEAEYLEDR